MVRKKKAGPCALMRTSLSTDTPLHGECQVHNSMCPVFSWCENISLILKNIFLFQMLTALKLARVVQLIASLSHHQPGGSSEAVVVHLAWWGNGSPLMFPAANHLRAIWGKNMSQVGVWKLSLTPGSARKARASELEDVWEIWRESSETRPERYSKQCRVANSLKGTEQNIVLKPLTSKTQKWFRTVGLWMWSHFRNFNNLTYFSKNSWEW